MVPLSQTWPDVYEPIQENTNYIFHPKANEYTAIWMQIKVI